MDSLLQDRADRTDRLLDQEWRAGQAGDQGRERHALEGAGRDLASRDERPRVRPFGRRETRRRRRSEGAREGAREREGEGKGEREIQGRRRDQRGRKEKEGEAIPAASKPEKPAGKATAAAKKPASDEDEDEEDDDGKPEEERPAAGPPRPLDPEIYDLLADPLRATRKRYLPPGKYTIEIRSAESVEKTTLKVEAEKETFFGGED